MTVPIDYQQQEIVLGCPISTLPKEACLHSINTWIESNSRPAYFVCANPHSLIQGKNDAEFLRALRRADLVAPDGSGMVIASQLLGGALRRRVTGSDIFLGLSKLLDQKGGRSYFFLGSTDETLMAIQSKIAVEFPNIRFAGAYAPPFKTAFSKEEDRIMIEAVNAVQPDVLWVGMTAPKQEKWIFRNRDKLNVKFIGAVGAVFDFYVGNVKRSHPFFQDIGLEWLPRLLQEPRRLWQRMFVSAPIFMLQVLKEAHRQRLRRDRRQPRKYC
jgi:N-acetylglucosaminyldiphosphoundecaprenol N-acetyl-beta-D-mannosaminyltransferase